MTEAALRTHIVRLLEGGEAHAPAAETIRSFPAARSGEQVPGSPHTGWRLLEHLRIAQWDILEFARNPEHVSPAFPDGYWPSEDAPPEAGAWEKAAGEFLRDLEAVKAMARDPGTDLFAPIPHGDGQTVLRELLLVADHNAYHLGQLAFLKRVLEA